MKLSKIFKIISYLTNAITKAKDEAREILLKIDTERQQLKELEIEAKKILEL